MVFRVRDKSLYWVKGGWKNNYYAKVFNMPRACNPTDTYYLITRRDHHSYLRSNPHLIFLSGPILSKLLKNLQTVLLRR